MIETENIRVTKVCDLNGAEVDHDIYGVSVPFSSFRQVEGWTQGLDPNDVIIYTKTNVIYGTRKK